MTARVAVVTGASRGLGRSIALNLVRSGVGVVGTYRTGHAEADAVAAEIAGLGGTAVMLPLDVVNGAARTAFVAGLAPVLERRFGRCDIDYLVNNAGIGGGASFADTDEALFDAMIGVNLKAPFFLTQALLPIMVDGGRVVMISTAMTRFTLPGSTAYTAAKAGLEGLVRCLALELGPRRIRVNAVAPGAVVTDIGGGGLRDSPKLQEMLASGIALGRVGQPDDVGAAVAALLGDGFGWANGTRIELSGGQSL